MQRKRSGWALSATARFIQSNKLLNTGPLALLVLLILLVCGRRLRPPVMERSSRLSLSLSLSRFLFRGIAVTRVPPCVRRPFPSKENRQISERDDLGTHSIGRQDGVAVYPVVCPTVPERRQGTHLCRSKDASYAKWPAFPAGHPRGHAWNRLRRRGPGGQEIGLGSRNLRPRAVCGAAR